MFTRREIVTQGAVGALAATTLPASGVELASSDTPAPVPPQDNSDVVRELRTIQGAIRAVPNAFETNSLAYGYVPRLRTAFTTFFVANQKFPEFIEAGMGVFYDIYDWHVRNSQPLQVGRTAENKLTIRFMYTTLVIRLDVEPNYLGLPFDKM